MRYAEYQVVPINEMMLKYMSFVTLGKAPIKCNVKVKGEKHIYIIPVNTSIIIQKYR